MKWIETSVKRPIGVIMIVLSIIALGLVSLRNLAIDLMPNIDVPIAVVATSYQGAGPEEIEKLITKPLESSLVTVQGMDMIQSQSQANSSLIVMLFKSDVNLDHVLLEVREKVDQIKGMLPEDAGTPSVLRFDPNQQPIMYLSVAGEGIQLDRLQKITENDIIPHLERQKGVASASIMGGQEREIRVELDRASLSRYGVTPSQVLQALSAENMSTPVGSVTKGTEDLQIRVKGEFTSLHDISNTIIHLPNGNQIRVRDIADVVDTFKEQTSVALYNDEPALMLTIQKQSDANTIEVADEVYKAIEQLNRSLPNQVQVSLLFDTSTFIRESIDSVVENLMYGGIFSALILILFLRSFRSTLVIGLSIPIAVISTFTLMYFTGQTVNVITMGGLALGVGMMVDSSIVILEHIVTYRQNGASRKEAAILGAKELTPAITASTLTTLVVFLPIVFVEGIAADIFMPLALTVSFSLLASLVVAITLVPMLSSQLISDRSVNKKENVFDKAFRTLYNGYQRLLKWSLHHRKTVVSLTIVAVIGSLSLIPWIGMEFMPPSGQGQIQINITAPTGYQLEETIKITNEVQERLKPYRENIDYSMVLIGGAGGPFGGNTNTSTIMIQLLPDDEINISASEMVEQLTESTKMIADAEITVSESMMNFSMGSPIQIRVNGQDQQVLEEIAEQIIWLISDIPGVLNPESSASAGSSELHILVDRSVAATYGLTYQQIMNEVSLSMNGQVATYFREDGYEYEVRVIMPEDDRDSIASLQNLLIQNHSGQLIPLSSIARFEQVQGPAYIQRENQQRQINITSDILGRDLGSVSRDIRNALEGMNMPDGYTYSMGGQTEEMEDALVTLAIALLFAIFLVYAVMAVQFESILYPFIIMFTMPTTVVGIMVGLFVTNTALSVSAMMGLIMLAGIVVNNGIILVDYINILRRKGLERTQAILEGAPSRLRPILMTTLTTILGMLPLALGWGEGSETNQPMAIAVIFGLTFSSLFTLFFVPVMYTYLDNLANRIKRLFRRKSQQTIQPSEMPGLPS